MEKTVRFSSQEMRKYTKKNKARLDTMYSEAPEIDGGDPGKYIGRGFAVIKDYINKNGRPRVDDPKLNVSIRLPRSVIANLRETGDGWQTRVGNYITKGVNQKARELQG